MSFDDWLEELQNEFWVLLREDVFDHMAEDDVREMYASGYTPEAAVQEIYDEVYEEDDDEE